ncbi:MAG: ribbon-helix-helix protein, CopG family [Deltaproteobacteria bacterium]|jgi:predicted transcriptional regulator|nr:ribbon-helix-helix protein, CopG family [Deltaproteobacteria bacterium]MDA8305512.1 ribbon-helix-helix protein, CopG family [Deltaproteobacteria bacterium]
MSESVEVTARISAQDKELLDKLATSTGRSKDYLISRAIREYLQNQTWQIEETKRAIEEADAGEFAGEEEVEAFFAKWRA